MNPEELWVCFWVILRDRLSIQRASLLLLWQFSKFGSEENLILSDFSQLDKLPAETRLTVYRRLQASHVGAENPKFRKK